MVFPLWGGGSMALGVGGVWLFCRCEVLLGARYWAARVAWHSGFDELQSEVISLVGRATATVPLAG